VYAVRLLNVGGDCGVLDVEVCWLSKKKILKKEEEANMRCSCRGYLIFDLASSE
jgi:hypothetical protein